MLIDSHCHLHDREFFSEEAAEAALENALRNGVEKIVCIGTDPKDSLAARNFALSHENVFWTYGIHPSEWRSAEGISLSQLGACWRELGAEPRKDGREDSGDKKCHRVSPVAIGEVGLDYHFGSEDRDERIKLFNEMLQLAKDNDLPLSFHVREAFDDFFGVIANFPEARGVVHSFTDSKKTLNKILNTTDFYVGVNGLATYSTLPLPPLDRILLETDAPFLAPVPFRGQTNEPAYIKNIAEWLAEKLDLSAEEIAEKTTENVTKLFHI